MELVKRVFGLLIVLLYFGVGVYCLTIDKNTVSSYPVWRMFGIAAIAFGIFRAIRVYQQFKTKIHEDDSID